MERSYLREVVLDRIDREDRLYFLPNIKAGQINFSPDNCLTNPLFLQQKADDRFRIIDGFAIFDSLSDHGRRTFPAHVFPRQMSSVELWLQRARKRKRENNLSVFSLIEGLINLLEGESLRSAPEETTSLSREIGLAPSDASLDHLKKLRRGIDIMGDAADRDRLGYKEIVFCGRAEKQKSALSSKLLKGLRLKGNKLITILEMIDDLERGFNIGLEEILEDEKIKEIPAGASAPQRYKLIKKRLTELRFPEWSALSRDWERTLRKIRLPAGVKIHNDPLFEADDFQLALNFSSAKNLKDKLEQIAGMAESQEFQRIFAFL